MNNLQSKHEKHVVSGILVVFVAGMILGDWPLLVGLIALVYFSCIWEWNNERARAIGDYWRRAFNYTAIIFVLIFTICFSCKEGDFPRYLPYIILLIPALIALIRTSVIILKKKASSQSTPLDSNQDIYRV